VKNSVRILSVFFLTAVYCFAIVAVLKSKMHSDFKSNPTSSHEKYISDLSTKLFCHTAQTESSANSFTNLPSSNFKNLISGFWSALKIVEQPFASTFSQYTSFSINLLINRRKADVIFPFHYFW